MGTVTLKICERVARARGCGETHRAHAVSYDCNKNVMTARTNDVEDVVVEETPRRGRNTAKRSNEEGGRVEARRGNQLRTHSQLGGGASGFLSRI